MDTGSFGSALGPGAAEAIKGAMARRGMGAGATDQSSLTQNPAPSPIPQGAPSAVPQPQAAPQASVTGLPPQSSESQLIIRALENRLKSISEIEKAQNVPTI